MKFEIVSASNGYLGHFAEIDRDSLSFQMRPGVIKFFGTTISPYVTFERFDSNFTVFGPWFSLLTETAKKQAPPKKTSGWIGSGSFRTLS